MTSHRQNSGSFVAARTRDDMPQHHAAGAAPARGRGGVHGLHFAVIMGEALERAGAEQGLPVPHGPEADVRGLAPFRRLEAGRIGIEGVHA